MISGLEKDLHEVGHWWPRWYCVAGGFSPIEVDAWSVVTVMQTYYDLRIKDVLR